jgi:hypothetical protein
MDYRAKKHPLFFKHYSMPFRSLSLRSRSPAKRNRASQTLRKKMLSFSDNNEPLNSLQDTQNRFSILSIFLI